MKNQLNIQHQFSRILMFVAIISMMVIPLGNLYSATPEVVITGPTAFAATNVTTNSFTASWSSVPGATSYKIYVLRRVLAGGFYLWSYVTGYNGKSVTGINTSVTGLLSGNTYKYYVQAYQGTIGTDNSNEIQVTTLPDAPVAAAATNITPTSFTANWGTVTGATSYLFYLNDQVTQEWIYFGQSVTATSFVITGLIPDRQYMYRVNAVNASGNSANSNFIFTTSLTPDPTVATAATMITSVSFEANWTAKPGASSYLLRITDDETQQFVLLDREVESTSFWVSGLNPNNGYRYSVKVKYGDVISSLSNWITFTTDPAAPIAIDATNITTSSFTANWRSVPGATSYRLFVWREVFIDRTPIWMINEGYNGISVSGTSSSVTGLSPGKNYRYEVSALRGTDESNYSNLIRVTTIPEAPVASTASAITPASFIANWGAVTNATSYLLYVWETEGSQYVDGYNGKVVTGTSETVNGLIPQTEYQYRLRALAGTTQSALSNYIDVTTADLLPPVAQTVSDYDNSSFKATWETANGATGYLLWIWETVSGQFVIGSGTDGFPVSNIYYNVSGLKSGTAYRFRLKSTNGDIVSADFSNTIGMTTTGVGRFGFHLGCS